MYVPVCINAHVHFAHIDLSVSLHIKKTNDWEKSIRITCTCMCVCAVQCIRVMYACVCLCAELSINGPILFCCFNARFISTLEER